MNPQQEKETPQELRELARRVRVIASGLEDRKEALRLLAYADEIDASATRLEAKRD